jgi:hypothetical protein
MVFVALALWLALSLLIALPVSLLFRHLDGRRDEQEEPIDPVELDEAMARHPTRRTRAA